MDTTHSQGIPAYSFIVKIEKSSLNNLTHRKCIHAFVSLLGPFYTILGMDTINIKSGNEACRSINHYTVSPLNEYAQIFEFLCKKIETKFIGYHFVPFEICRQIISGLELYNNDQSANTVFNALFNEALDLSIRIIGNAYFKEEQWIKKDYVDKGPEWKLYPPLSNGNTFGFTKESLKK